MKEKIEEENSNSNSDSNSNNDSINDMKINNDNMIEFRRIISFKNSFIIHINNNNLIYIEIHRYSFNKINHYINSNPEEYIVFLFNKKAIYTPFCSCKFSRNKYSISRNNSSSLSECSNIESIVQMRKENVYKNKRKSEDNIDNDYYILNNKNNKEKESENNLINYLNNILKNICNNIIIKRYIFFKRIYYIYLITGIIILLHYITFIFSDYNNVSFYKFIGIIFIMSLIFIGYIGIKKNYITLNIQEYNYIRNYLFWINFLILTLSMTSFIGLGLIGNKFKFVKSQGIFGYFIVFLYATVIITEIIYILYFDIINKEIIIHSTNKENNKINELSVQLFDMK